MHYFGSLGTTFPFKDLRPQLDAASVLEDGKFVLVDFNIADNITSKGERAYFKFKFNAPFLHTSSPLLCAPDYTQAIPKYQSHVCQYSRVVDVQLVKNGLNIRFEARSRDGKMKFFQDSYPAWFLFAYAPFSASMVSVYPQHVASLLTTLQSDPLAGSISSAGDTSIINYYAQLDQRPMSRFPIGHPENSLGHGHLPDVPTYNYDDLFKDIRLLRQLIYDVSVNPGFAFVYNVKPPHSYDEKSASKEAMFFLHSLIGRPNQSRYTACIQK